MSDVTEWNRGHPPRPGMVWMAGMWRQHQHALGPIEYVQSRVHEQHQPGMALFTETARQSQAAQQQAVEERALAMRTINQPSMPSRAMMEMLAVQKQADAMIRHTCGISDPGHSHTLIGAELRPLPEHVEIGRHWCRGRDGEEWVLTWHQGDTWSGPGVHNLSPCEAYECGWRYLGPAEWHDSDGSIRNSFTKLREEYHKVLATVDGPFGYKRRIEELCAENDALCAQLAAVAADTGPKADYHGPNDAAHRAVHDVTEHLMGGRVSDAKARRGLRDALDKADRPAEGRKVSDQAIGRALRFGGSPQIGLRLP